MWLSRASNTLRGHVMRAWIEVVQPPSMELLEECPCQCLDMPSCPDKQTPRDRGSHSGSATAGVTLAATPWKAAMVELASVGCLTGPTEVPPPALDLPRDWSS